MSASSVSSDSAKGRLWYFVAGGLSALVGLGAIVRPGLASVAIEQLLGFLLLASGVILLFSAVFGRAQKHRWLDLASSALRLVVGVLLIAKVLSGVLALTLIVASIFFVEGIFGVVFALRMRGKNPAWIWVLLNGLVAFVLSGMLYFNFPWDAAWALGLLFGINSLFLGASLILFAMEMKEGREG